MKSNRIVLLLLSALCAPLLSFAAKDSPPSSATICQTLDQLWRTREYGQLSSYLDSLERSFGDYVPLQISRAIHSYKYGGQVEDAIKQLDVLRSQLRSDITVASPVFMDLLDSRILRYEKASAFYTQQGISREQRLAERDPLKTTAFNHSKRWVGVDEMLYFNAPEVFLTEQGVIPARPAEAVDSDPGLKQKDVRDLLQSLGDEKRTMQHRKAVAIEVVSRRIAEGGISNLVQSLRAGDVGYTYQDTVEELVKYGPAAIPELIEHINNPAHFPSDQKMAIWALVRIGMADPTVIKTLQAISANTDRADLAKYAQDALRYLQSESQ